MTRRRPTQIRRPFGVDVAHVSGHSSTRRRFRETRGVVRRRVIVSGEVQGVFFREGCRRQAQAHGVAGWVRNRVDGTVEAVLEGEQEAVDQVLAWFRTGPPHATVDDIEVHHEEPNGERGFTVR